MPKIPIYAKVAFLVCIIIGFACCTATLSNVKPEPPSSSNEGVKDGKKIIEDKSVYSSSKDYVLDGEKISFFPTRIQDASHRMQGTPVS
jgi:hypothetical protein